ncbi:hypothetical protein E4U09_005033 [Claviceps aff. purpurea]|uniref:Uncharacterized protein n=1 Tax=Claviceps aff. purpurea TaxID=1967640 RepID=A0A9P7U4B5_9HYPO|nr:hypothetical protein E4U09_005033 [Claviceps aff. purpurea]
MNSNPTPTQTGSSAAEQSDFFAATEVARVFNLPAVQDGAQNKNTVARFHNRRLYGSTSDELSSSLRVKLEPLYSLATGQKIEGQGAWRMASIDSLVLQCTRSSEKVLALSTLF